MQRSISFLHHVNLHAVRGSAKKTIDKRPAVKKICNSNSAKMFCADIILRVHHSA
jgi:hypothetical protein